MVAKTTLSAAGNAIVPAYLALLQKGYVVSVDNRTGKEEWSAENSVHKVVAEDVLTLLGLVNVVELRGSDFKASDEEIDNFLKRFT